MMTLLTGLLLTAVIVVALYAFGVFNTPILDAFRVRLLSVVGSARSFPMVQHRAPAARRTGHHHGSDKVMRESGAGRSEVVVVTGASAGIGRAIVREFARHGASWVCSRGVVTDWQAPDTMCNASAAAPCHSNGRLR